MNLKWVYWGATVLLALMYVAGGVMYLTNIPLVQGTFAQLGYPAYLVPILAVVKLAAAVTIVWRFSVALTDLAYAGMLFHLLLALAAHLGVGDMAFAPAIVGLVLLVASFLTQNAARKKPSPYGSLAALRSISPR
ncbi:DoxX family protein [Devosia sp. WQ 349]|uniref:DoxX family protein n=1 Tax=Devosia sp. WQ 349K1 TaxID=2800329 RepID=UPI001904BFAB|nr:DoxX family protein [Devosia sp. WQ 349K1]MBK1795478.1 DoxX family protein [Devosia sp. WQ 349K1]